MGHPTLLCTTIDSTEIQLVLCSSKREHEVENLLLYLIRATVELVNLVDHKHRLLTHLNGLLKHETCLWHTALECIHQKDHTIRHIEHTLHLSTEVAMARSIYDIDLHALIYNGHVFGKDRNTSLSLKIIIVKYELSKLLLFTSLTSLIDHPVHESSLTMVNMGNDRNVSDFLHI